MNVHSKCLRRLAGPSQSASGYKRLQFLLQLLIALRERQALWFNGQKLARDAAEAQKDKVRAARLTELTKAVFSSLNDKRYYEVRKW